MGLTVGEAERRRALLIDGGRTGIRLARLRDGKIKPVGAAPGLPLLARPGGPQAAARAIAGAIAPTNRPSTEADVGTVVAGLTGLFEAPERGGELAAAMAHHLHARHVVVASDVVTSHLGALAGRPGVVAAVGTGAVVFGLAADGRWAKVDGWGYLLGDAGSGFDVGRRGLVAALRAIDGRGGSDALAHAAAARFGAVGALPAMLYAAENPAQLAASFAPDVAAVARDGDRCAGAIWRDATTALVTAIGAAVDRLELAGHERVLSWAGSMMAVVDLLRDPLLAALAERCPDLEVVAPKGGALHGAAALLDPSVRTRLTDVLWEHRG